MSDRSGIEWTDATWNPIRGCTKVSPGCKFCYAEVFAERFRGVILRWYSRCFGHHIMSVELCSASSRLFGTDALADALSTARCRERAGVDFIRKWRCEPPKRGWSPKMTLGKRAPGAGLQILLECERAWFIRELDNYVDVPRAAVGCVRTLARIVRRKPAVPICGDASVIASWVAQAPKHVNGAFRIRHGSQGDANGEPLACIVQIASTSEGDEDGLQSLPRQQRDDAAIIEVSEGSSTFALCASVDNLRMACQP